MPESPAVASLHDEQNRQKTQGGTLQDALKDTFPASDPVSQTMTTIAGASNDAPMVDEALGATKAGKTAEASDFAQQEMKAMRAEMARMAQSVREIVSASGRVGKSEFRTAQQSVERRVRHRPLMAVCLAALAGYAWGMTR